MVVPAVSALYFQRVTGGVNPRMDGEACAGEEKGAAEAPGLFNGMAYLPIDKHGADLLFQTISQRYERAPMVITSNRAYKHWSQIFNNDSTLTSAILDRVLHHAETVIIEGTSFRMKDEIDA